MSLLSEPKSNRQRECGKEKLWKAKVIAHARHIKSNNNSQKVQKVLGKLLPNATTCITIAKIWQKYLRDCEIKVSCAALRPHTHPHTHELQRGAACVGVWVCYCHVLSVFERKRQQRGPMSLLDLCSLGFWAPFCLFISLAHMQTRTHTHTRHSTACCGFSLWLCNCELWKRQAQPLPESGVALHLCVCVYSVLACPAVKLQCDKSHLHLGKIIKFVCIHIFLYFK